MAEPTVVGTPTVTALTSSSASITLTKPSGVMTGDLLVALLATNGSTSTTDFDCPGFTRQGSAFVPSDAAGRVLGAYIHPVADEESEPVDYTFTKTEADSRLVGALFIVRGVDLADPIVGESTPRWEASGTTVTLKTYPLDTTDPALTVFGWSTNVVSPNASEPTAAPGTEIVLVPSATGTAATRTVLWVGQETVSGLSDSDPRPLTWTSASGSAATGITLRGLSEPPEPVAKFESVDQFLATKGATAIHRAPAGYTQSAISTLLAASEVGFSAFEMSVGFTQDLKPFLSGFRYLDPLVLNDPAGTSLDPWIMDWDNISAATNTSGPTPEPLALLEDALAATVDAGLGIALVDPKYGFNSSERVSAMLDICDAHGGPTKILLKFDSPTSNTLLVDEGHARGYQAINYWGSDSASLATQQGPWDVLGGLYSADSTMWDALKSYGKPTWAAIVPNQAALDQAVTNTDADFYMVQSLDIVPVGPSDGPVEPPDPASYADLTNRDLEIRWLRKETGITDPATVSDLRKALYGESEHAYWASRSGLSFGSLSDHKYTAMKTDTGAEGSLADVSRVFWAKNGL